MKRQFLSFILLGFLVSTAQAEMEEAVPALHNLVNCTAQRTKSNEQQEWRRIEIYSSAASALQFSGSVDKSFDTIVIDRRGEPGSDGQINWQTSIASFHEKALSIQRKGSDPAKLNLSVNRKCGSYSCEYHLELERHRKNETVSGVSIDEKMTMQMDTMGSPKNPWDQKNFECTIVQ